MPIVSTYRKCVYTPAISGDNWQVVKGIHWKPFDCRQIYISSIVFMFNINIVHPVGPLFSTVSHPTTSQLTLAPPPSSSHSLHSRSLIAFLLLPRHLYLPPSSHISPCLSSPLPPLIPLLKPFSVLRISPPLPLSHPVFISHPLPHSLSLTPFPYTSPTLLSHHPHTNPSSLLSPSLLLLAHLRQPLSPLCNPSTLLHLIPLDPSHSRPPSTPLHHPYHFLIPSSSHPDPSYIPSPHTSAPSTLHKPVNHILPLIFTPSPHPSRLSSLNSFFASP